MIIYQIFVNGDVVYAQTWGVLTLKKAHRATLKYMVNFCQRGLKPLGSYTQVCAVFLCISNVDQTKLCNSKDS